MTEPSQEYNLRTLRQLMIAAFDTEELRALVMYDDTLSSLAAELARTDPITTMVDETISWCKRRVLIPYLVQLVKDANSRAYERFEPRLLTSGVEQPAKEPATEPTPEILTITSPIYLDLVRIPAGEFLMGSVAARDEHAREDELPPHRVHVPEFHIGQYPVTNLQYQAFVKVTGYQAPECWESGRVPFGRRNHPVTCVWWTDALVFCAWLSEETGQSFRLPTEAEWEKAARGTDGRVWPWGDEPPDKSRCNFGRHVGDTTPIGRYSPQGDSPYGCADMAGNVAEWCQTLYYPYPYRAGDGREEESGKGVRILRGGSWWHGIREARCAFRRYGTLPGYGGRSGGFRVARGPLEGAP